MDKRTLSLLVGGLLPAVLFGFSGILQKLSMNAGIGTGPFLMGVGLTTAVVGGLFAWSEGSFSLTGAGAGYASLFGIVWGMGIGLIAVSLRRYGGQISQLVPLYNMNTLITVLLGLAVLSEWRAVSISRICLSAVLIVLGGILAARS
jgi:uncharacterized membrane protein